MHRNVKRSPILEVQPDRAAVAEAALVRVAAELHQDLAQHRRLRGCARSGERLADGGDTAGCGDALVAVGQLAVRGGRPTSETDLCKITTIVCTQNAGATSLAATMCQLHLLLVCMTREHAAARAGRQARQQGGCRRSERLIRLFELNSGRGR